MDNIVHLDDLLRTIKVEVDKTTEHIIILAPYIKIRALKRVIGDLENKKVTIVARWQPHDILSGASDLEVYPYINGLGHKLYVHNDIHLKLFIMDARKAFIGSANITSNALGLNPHSNIEAMTLITATDELMTRVQKIISDSTLINQAIYNKYLVMFEENKKLFKQISLSNSKLMGFDRDFKTELISEIFTNDFIFTSSPQDLLAKIRTNQIDSNVTHDLSILNLDDVNLLANSDILDLLSERFVHTRAYLWQKDNITDNLFGKYTQLLHNALKDDPTPYRKTVKLLVANMFKWSTELNTAYRLNPHEHTTSLVLKTSSNSVTVDDIYPIDTISKDIIPQANDLNKVMELVFTVGDGIDDADRIARYFNFDIRQSSYYADAAEALGFITNVNNRYQITDNGSYLQSLEGDERDIYFIRIICNFKLVRQSLSAIERNGYIRKDDLSTIIASSSNLSGSTIARRAEAMFSWLKWIATKTKVYTVEGDRIRVN